MLRMPPADAGVLARRELIIEGLRRIVPGEGVIVSEDERRAYETDGLTAYRQMPMVVVLPSTTRQVSEVLRFCKENGVKVVPRGAAILIGHIAARASSCELSLDMGRRF